MKQFTTTTVLLTSTLVVLLFVCSLGVYATKAQEGWYWRNHQQQWQYQFRGSPDMPVFKAPPQAPPPVMRSPPPSTYYCPECLLEFHNYGGRDMRPQYDQWGNPLR